jgi:5-methylthioadenosine/S-adenosylhomocysteine deaminase
MVHASDSRGQVQDAMSRYGMSDLAWLSEVGLLTDRTLVVHAVQVDEDGLDLLARTGASVSHCPAANLYGGSGIAPVVEMRQREVRVTLGTDGPASNNGQSLFEAMKLATLLQKGRGMTTVGGAEAFAMATAFGADAVGLGGRVGRIATGYDADITLIDRRRLPIAPAQHPISDIVYAATPSCVRTVLVRGEIVVEDGVLRTVDLDALLDEAERQSASWVRRAGLRGHRERSRAGLG